MNFILLLINYSLPIALEGCFVPDVFVSSFPSIL